jgi:hypothetical protein
MRLLTVRHVTTYSYSEPVQFGEHRMMFRPRASHDLRLLQSQLDIRPQPLDCAGCTTCSTTPSRSPPSIARQRSCDSTAR